MQKAMIHNLSIILKTREKKTILLPIAIMKYFKIIGKAVFFQEKLFFHLVSLEVAAAINTKKFLQE